MNCKKCNSPIPQKRLEILPHTKVCVNCSTESSKRGVPVMRGTGDHTWVDLEILTQEQFDEYNDMMNKSVNKSFKTPNGVEDEVKENKKINLDELED